MTIRDDIVRLTSFYRIYAVVNRMWSIATDIQNCLEMCRGARGGNTYYRLLSGDDIWGEKTNEAEGGKGKLVPTWRSTGGALEDDRHVLGAADIMVGSRREREEA